MKEQPNVPEQVCRELQRIQEEAQRATGILVLLPISGTYSRAATAYDRLLKQAQQRLRDGLEGQ